MELHGEGSATAACAAGLFNHNRVVKTALALLGLLNIVGIIILIYFVSPNCLATVIMFFLINLRSQLLQKLLDKLNSSYISKHQLFIMFS